MYTSSNIREQAMSGEWFEQAGTMVAIDVTLDTIGGLDVYVASLVTDSKVRALAPSHEIAVRRLKEILKARAAAEGAHLTAKSARPTARRQAHVLVVDDDPAGAELARSVCRLEGHTVEIASNGVQALILLGQGNFELVLTDLNMSALDGVALVRRLRGAPATATLPIIGVTATGPERQEALLEAGVDALVQKPYEIEVLVAAVRRALDSGTGR
jgi:CheY-like chemotaxis protein